MKIMVGSLWKEMCVTSGMAIASVVNIPETALFGHFMPFSNTTASNKCPPPSQRKVKIPKNAWVFIRNRYNQIAHPSQDTIQERNTGNQDSIQ